MADLLTPLGLSPDMAETLTAVIKAVLLVSLLAGSTVFCIWLERKVSGRIQDRLGPTRVGGKFGWLQGIADGIKLLAKEDLIPAAADKMLFRIGPYIAFCGAFLAFIPLTFSDGWAAQNMNIGAFFILAVLSSEVFGVILAGYGSGSKWSLFGGMREAAQVVSYEVPRAISVLIPVIVAGTMNLSEFARVSGDTPFLDRRSWFWNWYVFHDPFTFAAFWTFFTCATAGCKRAPFDLAEAESELVAGFHTEYSGLRWSFFFMAEYGSMFAVSGLANLLFLGGWHLGFLPWDLGMVLGVAGNILNVIVFIFKCWLLVFVMIWVRWTLPRLRIDQVMMTCLKYLLPISCVLLLGIGVWQILLSNFPVLFIVKYLLAGACAALIVLVLGRLVTTRHNLPIIVTGSYGPWSPMNRSQGPGVRSHEPERATP